MSPWQEEIRKLAAFENVSCKLSGMVTETNWKRWVPTDFTPYLDVVLDAFGPERLMIGSDWPVCLVAGSYASVMSVVLSYIKTLTNDEQARILGETCAEFYGLST